MPIVAVQTAFTAASNRPEDVITNTLHFNDQAGLSNPTNMANLMWDFYTASYAGASNIPVSTYFTNDAFSGDAVQRLYNLDDPKPRVPILEVQRSFTPTNGNTLPTEVAVCMSYQAEPVSGQSQARRRGRIFVGPLYETANDSGRPSTQIMTSLAVAAGEMLAAANASLNERWVVWSEAGQSAADVVGGWVDNAFDTQRRRGWEYTQRNPWAEA